MYGLIASMRALAGRRDEVLALLLAGLDEPPAPGCLSYVVSADADEPDRIWVTEAWTSAQAHAASLQLPATKAAIATAMPLLTGEFTGQELQVAGGFGLADETYRPGPS